MEAILEHLLGTGQSNQYNLNAFEI